VQQEKLGTSDRSPRRVLYGIVVGLGAAGPERGL